MLKSQISIWSKGEMNLKLGFIEVFLWILVSKTNEENKPLYKFWMKQNSTPNSIPNNVYEYDLKMKSSPKGTTLVSINDHKVSPLYLFDFKAKSTPKNLLNYQTAWNVCGNVDQHECKQWKGSHDPLGISESILYYK